MINYSLLDSEALSQDLYFRKWVLGKLPDDDIFWENWQKANPEKESTIALARSLVLTLQAIPHSDFSSTEINDGIRSIIEETEFVSKPIPLWRSGMFRSLVACLFLMAAFFCFLRKGNVLDSRYVPSTSTQNWMVHRNEGDQTISFNLSDGSKITLGPHSELQYGDDFGLHNRIVTLIGEGFFEVEKDAKRPFWVITGKLVTKVIGTSFRVKAYERDTTISVSVHTGKVTVLRQNAESSKDHLLSEIVLLPNQKAVFDKEKERLYKTLVDTPIRVDDKTENSDFVFEAAKIGDVIVKLETYYGIEITFDKDTMFKCTITADLQSESLYEKLDLICEILQATYKITDGQIVLSGPGC